MIVNTLTNTSYKMLKMYRACPLSVKFKYIDKVATLPPDPKFDEKRLRGIRLHDELAEVINQKDISLMPRECEDFTEIAQGLIDHGAEAEKREFFDRNWNVWTGGWTGSWLNVTKDVRLYTSNYALVGDWKSGKKFGNEVDHFEQMRLYALTSWITNPGLDEYVVELYYIDQKDVWDHCFREKEMQQAWKDFDADFTLMFTDTMFRPKPSKENCKYCDFGPKKGNGHCPVGVP